MRRPILLLACAGLALSTLAAASPPVREPGAPPPPVPRELIVRGVSSCAVLGLEVDAGGAVSEARLLRVAALGHPAEAAERAMSDPLLDWARALPFQPGRPGGVQLPLSFPVSTAGQPDPVEAEAVRTRLRTACPDALEDGAPVRVSLPAPGRADRAAAEAGMRAEGERIAGRGEGAPATRSLAQQRLGSEWRLHPDAADAPRWMQGVMPAGACARLRYTVGEDGRVRSAELLDTRGVAARREEALAARLLSSTTGLRYIPALEGAEPPAIDVDLVLPYPMPVFAGPRERQRFLDAGCPLAPAGAD